MKYKKISSNPIATLLQIVGAKWKLLIIQALLKKEMRFSELKKALGCTSRILQINLTELAQDGLVVREEDLSEPNRVEYYLTDIGYTLKPVIDTMEKWGKDYKRLKKLMEKYSKIQEM